MLATQPAPRSTTLARDRTQRRLVFHLLSTRFVSIALALLTLPAAIVGCAGSAKAPAGPDVILITVDSLRADRPGFMKGSLQTPSMDALASGGVVFTQAVSPAPQTLPSAASLLTGLYPPAHGARDDGRTRLADGKETLATIFKAAGYRTAAFPGALALHPKYGLDRGFDLYAESFADIPRPSNALAIGIPASRIVDRAIEWLGTLAPRDRIFLWVNFSDPHFFYEPPSPFKEKYIEQPYDGEVAFVDRELGRLTRWLADHQREAGAVLVLAGNHGEGLGEGGEQYHGILLREPTIRVPLLIRAAGSTGGSAAAAGSTGAAATVADPVSLVDVAPTILDLAGASTRPAMQGVSLAGYLDRGTKPDASRPIYFETPLPRTLFGWAPLRGIRSGPLKYVEAPGTGRAELHDLASDPAEASDLAASRPDDARRLAAEAEKIGGAETGLATALPDAIVETVRGLQLSTAPPPSKAIHPATMVSAGNAALQARRALQRQMYSAAQLVLQDALKQDPDNNLALVTLATLKMSRGYQSGEAQDKRDPPQKRIADALDLLRRAQARYPADAEPYHMLGHVVLTQAIIENKPENMRRSGALFETAARLDPMNEEALYDSACFTAASNKEVSLNFLEAAIRNGFRDYRHMAQDPDLNPIRNTARFKEITGGRAVAPPQKSPPAAPEGGAPAGAGG